jgi:hypothetical protein
MVRRHAEQVIQVMQDQVVIHADALASGRLPQDNLLALFAAGRPGPVAENDGNDRKVDTDPDSSFVHSADYRSATWRGQQFTFTPRQAQIVEILHHAHTAHTPDVSWRTIKNRLAIEGRMSGVFKRHSAWNTLVVSRRQGLYRLDL